MFDGVYAMQLGNLSETVIYKECRSCKWARSVKDNEYGCYNVICYHDPKTINCRTRDFMKCAHYAVDTDAIEKNYKRYRITDK